MQIPITINQKKIEVDSDQSVLEAARAHDIEIPTLCYHKDLSPVGSCRLCLVEVKGMNAATPACTLPVKEDMEVFTETPALQTSRKVILEMLLQNYHDAGYALGDRQEDTEFIHWVKKYHAEFPANGHKPQYAVDSDSNPFIWVDRNKCILCTRCVRACEEVQGRFVWGIIGRGSEAQIAAGMSLPLLEARCESCGACVAYCPTGALDNRMSVGRGSAECIVTTTCTYCGVGCQLDLNVRDNRVIRVTSNPEAPVNGMHLCVKGRYGYDFIHHPDRLKTPLVRAYLLEGKSREPGEGRGNWVETDWNTALDIVARKLIAVKQETGPGAVGVLTSAKCTNEENYLMQKFARQVVGTHSVDHCARL